MLAALRACGSSAVVGRVLTRNMAASPPFARLPPYCRPRHYELALHPDLRALVFSGSAAVQLQISDSPKEIVFNSLDLNIKKAVLKLSDGSELIPSSINISVEQETATLSYADSLPNGESSLYIEYTGEINDKMKGFYRSKYLSPDGEERYAAVTQFEATDARRCFPCWDEPAIKSTFDITLTVPKDKVALSNMPVKSQVDDGDLVKITFDRTPIMSTYLVAIVVGEFDYVENTSEDGVLVRVYTPVGKKDQGVFALEVATKVLPYYKDYFDIAYPLPKIDLIAIADFSAGAMENWGLVTYRETCLLVDPENTSATTKQWVALVVGHELAHQWFGNLVTMEWWTHLWLNEGYATFVEYLCVNHLFPDYDIWTQFVVETYIRALELDCLKNSHPIEVPVGHPSEIDEIFDDISYSKGASVIRMLHKYIGDDDFRKGMNLYLTRHQYKNTFTEDLWAALEEVSNKPVGAIMSTWTKQMGFPIVHVTSQQVGDDRVLTLSQEKFCADGVNTDNDNIWMIPISISAKRDPQKSALTTLLENKSQEVVLKGISKDDWIKVNPGAVGFYRVQYSNEELLRLVTAVRNQELSPLDRLGLLVDFFAMVPGGHSSTVDTLLLLDAFSEETNFTVWVSIANCLSKISIILAHTHLQVQWKYFCRKLLSNIAKQLGWDAKPGESHLETLLRSLILNRMISYEDPDTIAEATRRFDRYINFGDRLAPDLRSPCYRGVLLNADEGTLNQFLDLYRSAELHEEKDRIGRALGVIKDVTLLEKVLQFSLTEDVRAQDTVSIVTAVAYNSAGINLSWDFFKSNWQLLIDRYQGGFLLSRLVKSTTENFSAENIADDVEQFFKDHCTPGAERTVQQSVETIRLHAGWLKRDLETTTGFLMRYT